MDHREHLQRDVFSSTKAQQFSGFLRALFDAWEYSVDLAVSPWSFAIGFDQLANFDIKQNDLRWMIGKGWVRVDKNTNSNRRTQDSPVVFELREEVSVVIADHGLKIVQDMLEVPQSDTERTSLSKIHRQHHPRSSRKPNWDFERRELVFDGEIIKRFRWPAPNQETILSVFAEEDWPIKISDPLPPNDIDPKRRLGDTIKCLNRNQFSQLIRFRGDGTGEGVIWEDLGTTR